MLNFLKTEAELSTHEDKWFYLLKNLNKFDNIPAKLQDKIFKKVFKIAEIAKYSLEERQSYIQSLKYYLDLKNSLNTAMMEGEIKGELKGKMEKTFEFAKLMKENGEPIEKIIKYTKLTKQQIEVL
jgi:predicted transposase/invertase (TIGR01784 family)